MKRLLVVFCVGLSTLLIGCATSPSSTPKLTEFKTLTLERSRARAGRAAILALAPGDVTISRVGGQAIAPGYHSIIVDAVPQSIGIRMADGGEQFFRLALQVDKRYLLMSHRDTDSSNKAAQEQRDFWVQDAGTGEVVYGERSPAALAAMQKRPLAMVLEHHRAHLRALFLDAS